MKEPGAMAVIRLKLGLHGPPAAQNQAITYTGLLQELHFRHGEIACHAEEACEIEFRD